MTKRDFSVKNLIEWIETKPADEGYNWADSMKCLLGQWCASKGLRGDRLHDKSCALGQLNEFYDIALRDYKKCTFGAALKRAKALVVSSTNGGSGK